MHLLLRIIKSKGSYNTIKKEYMNNNVRLIVILTSNNPKERVAREFCKDTVES